MSDLRVRWSSLPTMCQCSGCGASNGRMLIIQNPHEYERSLQLCTSCAASLREMLAEAETRTVEELIQAYGRAEREAGASLVDCDGIRNDEPDGPGTNSSNLFQRAKDLRMQLIQSISKTRGSRSV